GNSSVVDQNIQPAESLEGSLDQALGSLKLGHVVSVGDCFTASAADLLDYQLRDGSAILYGNIVDHDPGALGRKQRRFGPTDTGTAAGHDCYFTGQPFSIMLRGHFLSPLRR